MSTLSMESGWPASQADMIPLAHKRCTVIFKELF